MHLPSHTPRRRGTRVAAVGLALAGALALASCSPPGPAAGPTDAPSAGPAATLGTDPVKLVVYDGAGLKAVNEALTAEFTKQHPNVTFELRLDPDNVQAVNAPRVLSSDTPPDVARINALSDIVKDNLLAPLTDYAALYKWDRIPAGQMAQYTVDENGVRGTGTQYTVASGFTMTGVYSNRDLAAQVGIDGVPATVAEYEAALQKAKDAGLIGISAGNQNGQVATSFQFLLNNNMGQEAINGWIFHAPDATMDTPEAAAAGDTVADWAAKGYFGDKAGFGTPPVGDSGKALAMSDPLSNFGIPAKSKNKDAAAAFLEFLLSDEARQIVVDHGFAPSGPGEALTGADELNNSVQAAFAKLVADNGQVQFIQNASNGATAEWNVQLQLLVSGNATGASMVKAVQAKYEDEVR